MQRRDFLKYTVSSLVSLSSASNIAFGKSKDQSAIKRIAFGSCASQDNPQPIWESIGKTDPDMFLFIGDNIYADTEDMNEIKAKYDMLGKRPEFLAFRSKVPVLAIWDDHDYGINDGGIEYPHKEESKKIMLDFFGEPADSDRRKRAGNYTSYLIGPEGKRVQLLLLDLRWFRTPLLVEPKTGEYMPNNDKSAAMMGAEQWAWFEEELKKPCEVRIVVSPTQFCAVDHRWEKWSNYPQDKERMLACIDNQSAHNVVFISGDMHYAELSSEKTPKGRQVWDLTSSGMNYFEPGIDLPNRNRVVIYDKAPNFGIVDIEWKDSAVHSAVHSAVKVHLQARNIKGETVISQVVPLSADKV